MAIRPNTITRPETDLALADREGGGNGGPPTELERLRLQLVRAKQHATITQAKSRLANKYKCECFERGWMAAIAEIESGAA